MPQIYWFLRTTRVGIASDLPPMLPKIEYFPHAQTAQQITVFFPGLSPENRPVGEGSAIEILTVSTQAIAHAEQPNYQSRTRRLSN